MQVTIIGRGEIGSALWHILRKKEEIRVASWDKNIDIVPNQQSLSTLIPSSDVVFICVATWSARGVLQTITPLLAPHTIVVTLCKGFEKETCTNVYDLFTRNLPSATPFVFLGGPMIAEELLADTPTVALVASNNPDARRTLVQLFHGTLLRVQESNDVRGAAISGALKNVYALGLGIADALGIGSNAHGVLVAIAVQEMMFIVEKHGANPQTALGLAGIADLVATSQSANSTNYTTGVRFAQGLPPLRGSEALNTIFCLSSALTTELPTLPFLKAVRAIVLEEKDPQEAMHSVLA
jgi:glycerol-3-phosphate dehydrogenase